MKTWIRLAAIGVAVALSPLESIASATPPDSASVLLRPTMDGVYSGYSALAPAFTTLTGHWKQPAVTCAPVFAGLANSAAALANTGASWLSVPGMSPIGLASKLFTPQVGVWIGLEGMNGSGRTLVQTGTQVNCVLGVPQTVALFDVPSTQDQVPAVTWATPPTLPGDDIQATITWDGHDTYRMTLSDLTHGWRKDSTYHFAVIPRAAMAIVESVPDNVPTFSPVSFTDVTANGKPLAAYDPAPQHINSPTIAPTPLQGTTFTVPAPPS